MRQAVSIIGSAADLILTGIGASWNAALAAGSLFYSRGRAVHVQEAGELLHFTAIPRGAVIIAISTGRSIEIVQLLAKAKASGAAIIGATNCTDSPLAQASAVVIVLPTKLDHGISVNTYSALLIASDALASSTTTGFASIASQLSESVAEAGRSLDSWREQVEESNWLATGAPYYFLARGGSLGTCQEARLLWERRRKNFRDRNEHKRLSARSAGNRRGGCAVLYVDRSGADARSGFVRGSRSEEARCIGDAHRREPSARCRRLGVPVAHFSSSLAVCN
jgi:D-arabinose 5-phosphate isomerase GutQ